jgi:hypothetical protein
MTEQGKVDKEWYNGWDFLSEMTIVEKVHIQVESGASHHRHYNTLEAAPFKPA